MAEITRHVGKIKDTGIRAVVVFRKLPDDPENCLIVESDRLPDMYHDNLMKIVNSTEAQSTTELFEVLNRRKFADGNNALQALHYRGFLRKVAVTNMDLYPLPNHALPLQAANAEIDGVAEVADVRPDASLAVPDKLLEADTPQVEQVAPTEPHTGIAPPDPSDPSDPSGVAQALLQQAALLETEAKAKKEKAYTLDPSLKPKRGRPKMTAEEKKAAEKNRLAKQRERTAKNRAKKKAEENKSSKK